MIYITVYIYICNIYTVTWSTSLLNGKKKNKNHYVDCLNQNEGQKHNCFPQKQFLSVDHCSQAKGEHR